MADEEEMFTATAVAEAAVGGQEEQEQENPEAAAVAEAAEAEAAPAGKKKIQRKPKRRTMDAHFWGMSDAEIASIKASLAAEAEAAASSNEGGNKDATLAAPVDGEQEEPEHKQKEQSEQVEEEEIIPEGQLPKKEIEERRRILHTDWRMAAFSQFAHCFPHLCIKEFSIEKLERDLDGTDPGSYVGEVISRLLYHLTKDSSLA